MRGGGGGCENNLKVGGMPERVQKDKMQGGCCGKKLRGDAGEGKEDKMRGGEWCFEKTLRRGCMPERVQKMKCGGGGMAGKNWGEGGGHTQKIGGGGGGQWKIMSSLEWGSNIKWNSSNVNKHSDTIQMNDHYRI